MTEEAHATAHGNRFCAKLGYLYILFILFVVFYFGGEGKAILVLVGIFPAAAALLIIRRMAQGIMKGTLLLEMFFSGAFISIPVVLVLSIMAQRRLARAESICSGPEAATNPLCDAHSVLFFVIVVGLVEELSKLAPLMRLRVSAYDCPRHHNWWYRVCTTPFGFFLSGCASGAGFACVENVQYVLMGDSFSKSIGIGLMRAVLCIPGHVAYCGISAGLLALWLYPSMNNELGEGLREELLEVELDEEPRPERSQLTIGRVALALGVPAIMHGLYDAGLTLASKYGQEEGNEHHLVVDASVMVVVMAQMAALLTCVWVGVLTHRRTFAPASARAVTRGALRTCPGVELEILE